MDLKNHPTVLAYQKKKEVEVKSDRSKPIDSQWLKDLAIKAGADDAGLVEIARDGIADQNDDILGIFPETRSLMSIICRINPENIRCVSRAVSDTEFVQGFHAVNAVARNLAFALRKEGIAAMTPSAGFPMDQENWPGKMWAVSHKTIAVEAGMARRAATATTPSVNRCFLMVPPFLLPVSPEDSLA